MIGSDVYEDHLVPEFEIRRRLSRLQETLRARDRQAVLIAQNVDLYYFTGCLQNGMLYVPADAPPLFMVRRSLERAWRESSVDRIVGLNGVKDVSRIIESEYARLPQNLGLELDALPASLYQRISGQFGSPELFDASPLIRKIRAVKSAFEIELIKKAGELGRLLNDAVPRFLREGVREIELAGKLIDYAMSIGHLDNIRSRAFNSEMFSWHVISGQSGGLIGHLDAPFSGQGLTPSFPAGAGFRRICKGDPVLVDFGTCYDGYIADQTRMFALGRPDTLFLDAYRALQDIEAAIIEQAAPGKPCDDFYEVAINKARELGVQDAFLGTAESRIKFVGHGVGLEIDEFPFLAQGHSYPLETGHVFALELKIVYPDRGAVGFENMFVVTETGVEKVTPADETFRII